VGSGILSGARRDVHSGRALREREERSGVRTKLSDRRGSGEWAWAVNFVFHPVAAYSAYVDRSAAAASSRRPACRR